MRVRTPQCPGCQSWVVITVDRGRYEAWCLGLCYAQDMGLGPDLTERLITGICPPCWDEMFDEGEEVI